MSFADTLKRLHEQAHAQQLTVSVHVRDLRELLLYFDRLDADARLHYPPHVEMLANAAEKALALLHPHQEQHDELERALALARPKKVATPEPPITFMAPSFALFDQDKNGVLTTVYGNLAIFNTRGVAEQYAGSSKNRIKVLPVSITPVTEQ